MRRTTIMLGGLMFLAGCAGGWPGWPWERGGEAAQSTAQGPVARAPQTARPVTEPERRGGRLTAEGFDMTTPAERAAARAAGGGVPVGRTVASLGAPQEQGFWLRTGLVTAEGPGRVRVAGSDASVSVTLRPSGGSASAGSQLSLAAFRALDLPLTALPTLEVFAGG